MQDIKQQLKQKYGNDNIQSIRSMSYEEFDEAISLAVEQEKERQVKAIEDYFKYGTEYTSKEDIIKVINNK